MIAEEQILRDADSNLYRGSELERSLNEIAKTWTEESLFVLIDSYRGLVRDAQIIFERNYQSIPESYVSVGKGRTRKIAFRILDDLEILCKEYQERQLSIVEQYLQYGISTYQNQLQELVKIYPESEEIIFSENDLKIHADDPGKIKWNKRWKNLQSRLGITTKEQVLVQVLLKAEINQVYLKNFLSYLKAIGSNSESIISQFVSKMRENLKQIELLLTPSESDPSVQLESGKELISKNFAELNAFLDDSLKGFLAWLEEFHSIFQIRFSSDIRRPGLSQFVDLESREAQHWEREISSYPHTWRENQELFHNHINSSIELWKVQIHVGRLSDQLEINVRNSFIEVCENSIEKSKSYIRKIDKIVEKEDWEKLAQIGTGLEEITFFENENLIDEGMASLRFVAERLSSSVELIPKDQLSQFKTGKINAINTLSVALSSIVSFVLRTYYINPVGTYLNQLPNKLKEVGYLVQNSVHLISLNLVDDADAETDMFDKKRLKGVIRKSLQRLTEAQTLLTKIENETQEYLDACEKKTQEELNPAELVEHAAQFDREIKGEERLEGVLWLWKIIGNWFKRMYGIVKRIWTDTQDELDLVEREASVQPTENIYARLRNFVEEVSLGEELDKQLPFYYKQLFLGRPSVSRSYLPGRERELEEAQASARRMQNRIGGAMLVLGEALSGRTTFCEHVAEYYYSGKVYRINPPVNGSISLKDFQTAFQQSIMSQGKIEQLIESTLHGSVFILNDLELWWERSSKGHTVLNKLAELIDNYGDEYYFLVNCNIHSYDLIYRLSNLSERFITSIRLSPMSRDDIRKIVLSRHDSSSLNFMYKGQEENLLSNAKLNRLFRRYAELSSGNIGYAFLMWLANIEDFSQKTIYVHDPKYIDMPMLHNVDWVTLLFQLLVHHRLTKSQLKRIYRQKNLGELEEILTGLLRAGLIREYQGNAYTLNPFIYPFLIRQLKENQMISK